jgi:hypothetical protein
VPWLGLNDIVTLLLQILLGAAIYIGGSALFKLEAFTYTLSVIKRFLGKKRSKRG